MCFFNFISIIFVCFIALYFDFIYFTVIWFNLHECDAIFVLFFSFF